MEPSISSIRNPQSAIRNPKGFVSRRPESGGLDSAPHAGADQSFQFTLAAGVFAFCRLVGVEGERVSVYLATRGVKLIGPPDQSDQAEQIVFIHIARLQQAINFLRLGEASSAQPALGAAPEQVVDRSQDQLAR